MLTILLYVPSQGANKKSWFLYPQTKGEVEENIKNLQFARTSIFRPGLLNRGELARSVESIGLYIMPNVRFRMHFTPLTTTYGVLGTALMPQ